MGRRTLTPRGWLIWLLATTGCQLAIGRQGVDTGPRKAPTVRVILVASTPALGAAALKALAVQPNIEASWPADTEMANEGELCAQARAGGFDYLARAYLDAAELIDTRHEPEGAYAAVRLDLFDPATCRRKKNLRREVEQRTRVLGQAGVDEATAAVLSGLAPAFANLFPDQVVLDTAARIDASDRDRGDGVFRDYRDHHYVGSLRVGNASLPDERHALLSCCFEPRAGDLLFKSEPNRVLEFVPSATTLRLRVGGAARTAAGASVEMGVRPLEGGFQFGLTLEELLTADTEHVLGTIEIGYGVRPAPRWAVALIAGGGGGLAARRSAPAMEADAQGAHTSAVARVQYQGGRQWFLRLDAGYIWSATYGLRSGGPPETFDVRGPLLRLGAGLM